MSSLSIAFEVCRGILWYTVEYRGIPWYTITATKILQKCYYIRYNNRRENGGDNVE